MKYLAFALAILFCSPALADVVITYPVRVAQTYTVPAMTYTVVPVQTATQASHQRRAEKHARKAQKHANKS